MLGKKILFFISVLIFQLALLNRSSAQKKIKLRDVTSFTLVTEGGMGSAYRKLEVSYEDGWKCYQLAFGGWKLNGRIDSTKAFIKSIPPKMLQQLLDLITKPDTGILIRPFNITTQELTQAIDTIQPSLKPGYKKEIIDSLHNSAILYNALFKAMHPLIMDDVTSYEFFITMKNGGQLKAEAGGLAPYELPWLIKGVKSYNPGISLIYNYISGNNRYPEQERRWFIKDIDQNIYQEHFMTRLNWEDLKNDEPRSYAIIKNTFHPVRFRMYKGASYVDFNSKKLPKYVQISTAFYNTDTIELKRLKLYEENLAQVFTQDNFLFRYMNTRPDGKITFSPRNQIFMRRYYHSIKKFYKEEDSLSFEKAQYVKVSGAKDYRIKLDLVP
jgi:hypothetical protein